MKHKLAPIAFAGLLFATGCASETATEPDSPSPTAAQLKPIEVKTACPDAVSAKADGENITVVLEVDFSGPLTTNGIWQAHSQSENCLKGIDDWELDPSQLTLEVHDSGVPKSVLYDGGHPRVIKATYSKDTLVEAAEAMRTVTDRDVWAWADQEVIDPELRDALAGWRESWEK